MQGPHLPQEIFDSIIDLLHNERKALKQCYLVSTSWVPRAQKRLFVRMNFSDGDYLKWSEIFPDPKSSPAYHTRTLMVKGTLRGAEEGNWIRGFSRVQELYMILDRDVIYSSFMPFRKLSLSLISLHVAGAIPHS